MGATHPDQRPANPHRVLVVDDDPSLLQAIAIGLGAKGYEVIAAGSGEEGLRQLRRTRPDLVLLDLGLPGMDGIEVIRSIRSSSRTPIIVVSARHQHASRIEALAAGADDYLTKPFGIEELLGRLRDRVGS